MRILSLFAVMALAPALGCASPNGIRHKPVTAAQRAECAARGGAIEGVGMFGTPSCVIPYADAGKACSNTSDCQGACLFNLDGSDRPIPKVGEPMTGTCEATNSTFGCFTEIDQGKAKASICVD